MKLSKRLKKALKAFGDAFKGKGPLIAFTLGSGLGEFAKRIKNPIKIPYHTIPGFPVVKKKVEGHAGHFVVGTIGGIRVIGMAGRQHKYEGISLPETVFGAQIMCSVADVVIFTNAVGSATLNLVPGDFVVVRDHIGSHDGSPLIGENDEGLGERFTSMHEAYNPKLVELALECALEVRAPLHRGVLFYHAGPNYESAAEVEQARRSGGDILTMSTVPEVIAARHMGVPVLTISSVTNMGSGLVHNSPSHKGVVAQAEKSGPAFGRLLSLVIKRMGAMKWKEAKKFRKERERVRKKRK